MEAPIDGKASLRRVSHVSHVTNEVDRVALHKSIQLETVNLTTRPGRTIYIITDSAARCLRGLPQTFNKLTLLITNMVDIYTGARTAHPGLPRSRRRGRVLGTE